LGCVIIHYHRHGVEIEAISLGHHTLPEAVGDVVGAQEAGKHDTDLEGDEDENCVVPSLEDEALKLQVWQLASGQDTPRVTRLGDGGFDEWGKVTAALELVLDAHATFGTESLGPLVTDLSLEVESAPLVGNVAGDDHESECDPGEEGIPCEEAAIIEENAGPAHDGGKDTDGGSEGGDNEFWPVAYADDVGMLPDIEPGKETDDEGSERVESHDNVHDE